MSEEERKFLEIVDLKKGFGSGEEADTVPQKTFRLCISDV